MSLVTFFKRSNEKEWAYDRLFQCEVVSKQEKMAHSQRSHNTKKASSKANKFDFMLFFKNKMYKK